MGITEIAKYTNLKGCPHTFGHLVFQWFQLHITLTVNLTFSTVYWAIVVFLISHDTFYLLGLASIAQCAYQSSKSHPPCPVDMSSVCPASRAASRQTGITVPSAGKTCHQTSNPLYLKPSSEFRNGLQHPPFTILPNVPFLKRAFVFTPSHSTKFIKVFMNVTDDIFVSKCFSEASSIPSEWIDSSAVTNPCAISGQPCSSMQRSGAAVTPSSWRWFPGSVCLTGRAPERVS